jgi:hypothetical protein
MGIQGIVDGIVTFLSSWKFDLITSIITIILAPLLLSFVTVYWARRCHPRWSIRCQPH